MKRFEDYFLAANRWALILMLGTMAVLVFVNVCLRYFTNQSIEWAEEVARHLMVWMTFLGAGPVLRSGGHIAVESLQDALPLAAARAVRVVVAILLFGFFAFMVWYGWLYLERTTYQMTPATQIPFAYVYAAMPVGGLLLFVNWLLVVRGYIKDRSFAPDPQGIDAVTSASL